MRDAGLKKKFLFLATVSITLLISPKLLTSTNITNKTYNNTRSQTVNLALINGAGIPEMISRQDCVQKAGTSALAIPWYSAGTMDGTYWAPVHKNSFSFATADANITTKNVTTVKTADLDARLFLLKLRTNTDQDPAINSEKQVCAFSFDPHQESAGVTFFFDQRLDTLLNGLYINITIPFAHLRNDLRPKLSGTQALELKNYFAGKTISGSSTDKQTALTRALIGNISSQTGFADIDVVVGYTLFKDAHHQSSLNLAATLPTGSTTTGQDLFQAVIGNHRHFGIGCGLTHDHRLVGNIDQHLALHIAAGYRYLLEANEYRTLGLYDPQKESSAIPYSFYTLLSPLTSNSTDVDENPIYTHTAGSALIPAANILTQPVCVTPGSTFDGTLSLVYNNYNFSFLTGYELYARQEETILINTNPLAQKQHYGIIKPTLDTSSADTSITLLTAQDLDISVAQTPSHTTHKIFCSAAWTFKTWSTYCNVGVGAHYELAPKEKTFQNWGINCSVGIGM